MNILFVAPRYHSNQIGLVDLLKKHEVNVNFMVVGVGASEDYSLLKPILMPIKKVFSPNADISKKYLTAIPDIKRLYTLLKALNIDTVVIRGGLKPMYSYVFLILKLFLHYKVVFYTQDPKYTNSQVSTKLKIQLGIAKLLRISWYTPVLYRGAQQPLFNNKDLIYVPFCPLEHKKRANVLKDKIIFMSVGKYEQRKNHMQLLNAFIRLSKDFSNVYLKIIGATGSNERESFFASLQDYIKLNNIDNNVELKKNLSYSEMQQEYLNSSVFVFPARKEPASISQIEALSYGLPVICSTDNGTAHYVINNVSGFLIEPTEESIYSAMKKYVEDRDLLFDHSQNAYNDIQENYSYDKIFNVISNLIS